MNSKFFSHYNVLNVFLHDCFFQVSDNTTITVTRRLPGSGTRTTNKWRSSEFMSYFAEANWW